MEITYEEMVPAAQAAFDKENKKRIKALKLSWVGVAAIVLAIILLIIGAVISSFTGSMPEAITSFAGGLAGYGCIPIIFLGILHSIFIFKKIWSKTSVIVFNWVIIVIVLCLGIFIIAGAAVIFLYKDTISYFKKKPLVYSFEHNSFMQTREAQEQIAYYNAVNTAYNEELARKEADNTAVEESLVKLKEMYDNSLISEDEYNKKKAELLAKL